MPATEDMVRDAMPLIDVVADEVARKFGGRLPGGIGRDDLESAGNAGLAEAARTWDAARGASFRTHAAGVIRLRMIDEVRALTGRRSDGGRTARGAATVSGFVTDPETGNQMPLADRRAADPAELAAAREPLARGGRRAISSIEAACPDEAEVGRRVASLRAAMFGAIDATKLVRVMESIQSRAADGDLNAAKVLIGMLSPGKSGVTVQQAVVIQQGDVG